MGAFKEIAIVEDREVEVVLDYHDYRFVENGTNTIHYRNDRNDLLSEFANAYARSLDTADEAVDVIEKPHHYVEDIASFICAYNLADDQTIAGLGYWECSQCGDTQDRMTLTIEVNRSCQYE
jgi:hypothetical protein